MRTALTARLHQDPLVALLLVSHAEGWHRRSLLFPILRKPEVNALLVWLSPGDHQELQTFVHQVEFVTVHRGANDGVPLEEAAGWRWLPKLRRTSLGVPAAALFQVKVKLLQGRFGTDGLSR